MSGDRLAARVDLEDLVAAVEVGGVDADLAVEAARAQQRRVEHVGTVGRRDEDDAAADVEAVHLDEQLVEGLLALVVAAAHAGAAVATDGVDLVDEDDGGRVLLGLLEQVADAAGADADEHLDEVGAGDRVERHAGLAGDGAGEQRLAGAGRAVEQDALGDLGADGLELGRLLEELLDLAELLDRLLAAGDVGERRLRHVLGDQLGLGLGELHDAAAATALGLVHQEDEQQDDQRERQQGREQRAEEAGLRVLGVVVLDRARVDLLVDRGEQGLLLARDVVARRPCRCRRGCRRRGSAWISWSPPMNVISLTSPSLMYVASSEVLTSSYPPLGARNWMASRTPKAARTIHSQGPLNMRFTGIFHRFGVGGATLQAARARIVSGGVKRRPRGFGQE